MNIVDHYNILGIDSLSTINDVKKQYKKLALKYHPDRSNHTHARQMFDLVTDSYIKVCEYLSQKNNSIDLEITLEQVYNGATIPIGSSSIKINRWAPHDTYFIKHKDSELRINTYLKKHELFIVSGDDLICNVEMDAIKAMVGTTFYIKHLNGKDIPIEVKPPIQYGDKITLPSLGMPIKSGKSYGDLIVRFKVYTPEISDCAKQVIKALNP